MVAVRDFNSDDMNRFGEVIARLERSGPFDDIRKLVLPDIVKLLKADFGASYVWNGATGHSEDVYACNISAANLARYKDWFQYCDPMSEKLRSKRRAALVDEVIDRSALMRSEFYNDFLLDEGMYSGINLFLFDRDLDIGDFRIWRNARQPEFSDRELGIMDALSPFLTRALMRTKRYWAGTTSREREVVELVARGCTDHDIARILGISFGTVRTHINRLLEKRSCANRAELAAMFSSRPE
ncbi:helix-turn-helix transcriptional regulator [Devosia sp. FKR38]|uniref:helix-turn-helix transcriptional regulator n=1 Tax=Devosia sp. FKR38 TaxID=2562312 RepID=UPI0010BFE255|nr:helix-turn-helix transcriptional regulator [Devosia sp. FKR38]